MGTLRPVCTLILVIATIALLQPSRVLAQATTPVRLSGSFGVTARGYQAAGIDNRRAPGAIEATGNANFSVFGLSSGLRLTYSTDQSGIRQSVNRFAFQTDWSNGRVAAGDVSPEYSMYSISGSTVRGGLVEWRPGGAFIGVSGGRLRRAVSVASALDPRGSAFARWLGAARVGYGHPDRTHFHIIGSYSQDTATSLEDAGSLRPQVNVTVTPDFATTFAAGRVRLRGSGTVSAITDDDGTKSGVNHFVEADLWDIRATYAAEVEANVNAGSFGVDAGFQRIMPGFESHGLSQIRSDEQTIRLAPRVMLSQGRATLAASVSRSNTNLVDNQLTTVYRDMATLTAAFRVGNRLTLAANYAGLRNTVEPGADAPEDLIRQRQVGHNVVVTPVLIVGSTTGIMQTIAVNASWQSFRDQIAFESTNRSIMVTHTARLTSALSTSASGGLVRSDATLSTSTITTADIGLTYRITGNWTSNVSGGWARSEVESMAGADLMVSLTERLSGSVGTSYSLTNSDVLRLDVRGSRNEMGEQVPTFSETTATLSYTHRF